jgi:nucleoside-diphosphate-sugar epimerase
VPKRILFTGGTGKAGRHMLPWLLQRGHRILNFDLKPFDHPGIATLIGDITDEGQVFNAMTMHFGFDGFTEGRPAVRWTRSCISRLCRAC